MLTYCCPVCLSDFNMFNFFCKKQKNIYIKIYNKNIRNKFFSGHSTLYDRSGHADTPENLREDFVQVKSNPKKLSQGCDKF
jgi:hypothetical protein